MFIPLAIGEGTTIAENEPLSAICWFTASAISGVIAVFLWDEVVKLARRWRIGITAVAVLLIFILTGQGDSWVASKAEERAKEKMTLYARESVATPKPSVPLNSETHGTTDKAETKKPPKRSPLSEVGKIDLAQLPDEELESMSREAGQRMQRATASYSESWQYSRRSYDRVISGLKDEERYKAMDRQLELESGIREQLERETKKVLHLANPVREEIVRRLTRRNEQTDDDRELAVIFDAALTGKIDVNSVGQMSMYLQKLPGRLSAARSR